MNNFLATLTLFPFFSWLYFLGKMFITFRQFPPLRDQDLHSFQLQCYPLVSILIPARNEEANITHCLKTLQKLTYPNYEIIIIDDRSEDQTLQLATEQAAKDPRITVLHLDRSELGWSGKNYALHRGVELARGDWFLFTDADTRHAPESLSIGLHYVLSKKIGFLSLLSRLDCATLWEKLIQPIAGGLMMLWYPLEKLNDPRSSMGFANGQYLLIDKPSYAILGGHDSVKDKLLEDVALYERAKELGLPCKVQIGTYALKTRMYRGFSNSWNGWKRIFLHLSEKDPIKILRTAVGFFFLGVLPVLLVVVVSPGHYPLYLKIFCSLTLLLSMLARGILNQMSRLPVWPALLYPLGAIVVFGILTEAFIESLLNKKTLWRGHHY